MDRKDGLDFKTTQIIKWEVAVEVWKTALAGVLCWLHTAL